MDRDEARELAVADFTRRMRAKKLRGGFRIDDWRVGEPYEDVVWGIRGAQPCFIVEFVAQGDAEARGYRRLAVAVDQVTGEVDMLR